MFQITNLKGLDNHTQLADFLGLVILNPWYFSPYKKKIVILALFQFNIVLDSIMFKYGFVFENLFKLTNFHRYFDQDNLQYPYQNTFGDQEMCPFTRIPILVWICYQVIFLVYQWWNSWAGSSHFMREARQVHGSNGKTEGWREVQWNCRCLLWR